MTQSPGHKEHPEHKVEERRSNKTYTALLNGKVIARSNDVIKVVEDDHPVRFYFPREAVKMEFLHQTDKTTRCPFKGERATHFTIKVGNDTYENAAWSYEAPFDEHRDLKDRIAFYRNEVDELDVHVDEETPSATAP